MNKTVLVLAMMLLFGIVALPVRAQMMTGGKLVTTVNPTQIVDQKAEEAEGQKLFDDLQNQLISCDKLTDADFEKVGEYVMSKMFGDNTTAHIAMNNKMKSSHGEEGEVAMHERIGKNVTGCYTDALVNKDVKNANADKGFDKKDWEGRVGMMMAGGYGFGIVYTVLFAIVVFDLVLLGVWLWRQVRRKNI